MKNVFQSVWSIVLPLALASSSALAEGPTNQTQIWYFSGPDTGDVVGFHSTNCSGEVNAWGTITEWAEVDIGDPCYNLLDVCYRWPDEVCPSYCDVCLVGYGVDDPFPVSSSLK